MRLRPRATWAGLKLIAVIGIGLTIVLSLSAGGKKELTSPTPQVNAGKPVVVVSILPQKYFVRRIGGDSVSVLTLVGPGQNHHTYEITPRQMEELSMAKVWILANIDFEDRIKQKVAALYPNLTLVDGTAGVKFRLLEAHDHDADPKGEREKTHELERDRHTWLGQEPAKILAGHVQKALGRLMPHKVEEFQKNYDSLVREIDGVFNELKKDLAPLKGKSIYVYHPAFGYFLDEFEIVQKAVETGGKEPNPQTLASLIQSAKKDRVKAIFVQAQFPTQAAQTLAKELKAEVVPLDPLAENWLENIRRMGEALKKAIR
ncbi:MAG: zinc ABC transporter substrate-binding protein [Spirochaetes bacterium]|nr:zinc ABC transporter substrate-binding protein [Spirochaetota bacterium]